jgi:hypothetical protein
MSRAHLWFVLSLAVSSLLFAGCVTRPVEKINRVVEGERCTLQPLFLDKDVDLLFVIDNSQSMGDEQENLKQNFPKLIDALRTDKLGPDGSGKPCTANDTSGCKIPNVRIGIVSTDLGAGNYGIAGCEGSGGDQGKLQNRATSATCTPPTDAYISYHEGQTNVPGAGRDPIQRVKDAFSCIAGIGIQGCGFEQTLEASRRALDPSLQVNPGFLRNDALLAVVYITDEDDCSASNPQLYDPTQRGLTDPLGPHTSFRCFEFGVHCDCAGGSTCTRTTVGPRQNCVPGSMTGGTASYLHTVDIYKRFFNTLKTVNNEPNPRRLIMAAIAGPTSPVVVEMDGTIPTLKPSCYTRQGDDGSVPAIRIKALVHHFAKKLTRNEKSRVLNPQSPADRIPCFVDYGNGREGPCVAAARDRGTWKEDNFTSICTTDFSPALKRLGQRIVGALGTLCLSPPALTDKGGILCEGGDRIYLGKNGTADPVVRNPDGTYRSRGDDTVCKAGCLSSAHFNIEEIRADGARKKVQKCPARLFDANIKRDACGDQCPCWRVVKNSFCEARMTAGSSPYAVEVMRQGEAEKGTYANVCAPISPLSWYTEELAGIKQCTN